MKVDFDKINKKFNEYYREIQRKNLYGFALELTFSIGK